MITIDQIMGWHPCAGYSRERVAERFARGLATSAELDAAVAAAAEVMDRR